MSHSIGVSFLRNGEKNTKRWKKGEKKEEKNKTKQRSTPGELKREKANKTI